MRSFLLSIVRKLVKPCILFESKPAFSDNSKAVFDELVRRGYDRKYHLIWFVDEHQAAIFHRGKIILFDPRKRRTIFEKIRNYVFFYHIKCTICSNSFLDFQEDDSKEDKKQYLRFYLSHGIPIKSVKEYYTVRGRADYLLSPSQSMNALMATEFGISEENVIATGFARNDVFSLPPIDLNAILKSPFKKVIIWYPTYRQNKNGTIDTGGDSLPLIHDERFAELLNDTARECNVLLIVKPHFMQDVSKIHKLQLDHIRLIDDSFFEKNDLTSYQMLAASDALITDYSSVYYDYTLRDRPICVIWEDVDSYRKFPGFAVNLETMLTGAEKVYTIEELCEFVRRVANGVDRVRNERRVIRDLVHYSTDGRNAERSADYIVRMARL